MRVFIFLFLALASTCAVASESVSFKVDDVLAQQREIRNGMVAGEGRYAKLSQPKRDELMRRQDRLTLLLDGKDSSTDLSRDDALEALNTLEWIEATVNNETNERLVCKREKALGSNFTTRICRTAAQMQEERDAARRDLDRSQNQNRF